MGLGLLIAINYADITAAVEGAVGGVGFGEEALDLEVPIEKQSQDDDDDRQGDEDDEPDDDQGQEDQDREDLGDRARSSDLDGSPGC